MSDRMPGRMPERMAENMPGKTRENISIDATKDAR
jgi:hypothetical protein